MPTIPLSNTRNIYNQNSSVTVANTTVETTLISSGIGSATVPAGYFFVGQRTVFRIAGYQSELTATKTMRFKIGSTTVITLAGFPSGSTPWIAEFVLTCRTVGASGTIAVSGFLLGGSLLGSVDVTTPTVTIDTTAAQSINATVQMDAADPSDSVTCTQASIESH